LLDLALRAFRRRLHPRVNFELRAARRRHVARVPARRGGLVVNGGSPGEHGDGKGRAEFLPCAAKS
jgi:hypothetical protein